MLTPRQRAALAVAMARRLAAVAAAEARACAARLRSFYHPKQAAFFSSRHRLKATKKTRRAGATTGGVREFLARAIEHPGWRGTYCASTRIEARARAWRNDTHNGFVDLLVEFGIDLDVRGLEQFSLGGVVVTIREAELLLDFSNGSQIELFGADNLRAIQKKRGAAKHVFWLDEVQDFVWLEEFYKGVVVGSLTDTLGEAWLTGTPGRDCVGMFFEITRDDEIDRLPGWEVHTFAQIDNPFFGATVEERWARTAARALSDNGWTPDDPDYQREILGRWVKADARYVYAVHQRPTHELVYAAPRVDADGFPAVAAALADLPEYARRTYYLALGVDLGTVAAFAFVLWAWSLDDPCLYEVASWKKSGLDYDEMAAVLQQVRAQATITIAVADAGGGGRPAVLGWEREWSKRYAIPIVPAEKSNKIFAIGMVNNDIRTGKIRLRDGSPLHVEWQRLVWAKLRGSTGQPQTDPRTPRDCADAALYAHRHSYHHRGIVPVERPPVGSDAWAAREEADLESIH